MIDEITKFLNKYDMDVRKSHDARFMDQSVHQTLSVSSQIVSST